MANGDPLLLGRFNFPDNRATSGTTLTIDGDTNNVPQPAFTVRRIGAPVCAAAIRGDNLSTGPRVGQMHAGVLGLTRETSALDDPGVGVFGGMIGLPNVFFREAGVMGFTNSFGVVGRALTGLIVDEQNQFVSGTGVVGQCDAGVGVHGVSTSGWGIIGQSNGRAGVTGKSVTGVGVEARSEQSHGLQASAQSGVGVVGDSVGNNGVLGRSRDAIGVEGFSQQGLAGVRGSSSSAGYGVIGESDRGVGVFGESFTRGYGVVGVSQTGTGVYGGSQSGLAGVFVGNVQVHGNFHVVGGSKSAAVKHPDGTHRSLFCLESTESYFEDFGEVALTGASVMVKLDKDFASLVKRNKYQVFLTSYGPEALYVRKRGTEGFEIARVDRGASNKLRTVRVGYRIVARRADLKPARLPKIKMPTQKAEVTKPDLASGKAKRKRADVLAPLAKLDPLPAPPRIPSPDLEVIAEAKLVDVKGKGSSTKDA